MSGTTKLSEITFESIIEEIKASHQKISKAFEEHNNLVNKSLDLIQQMKTETKIEVIKVKDPLEEIKNVKELFDRYELDLSSRCGFLTNIFNILLLYNKDKISASFKDIFLNILKRCLDINTDTVYVSFHFKNQLKENILKVRDIRWLLLEMEKYPQYFQFTEDDLTFMKDNGASRDNIYLVKKFFKKDGDYEEYYPEEEGGGIKFQYHMTGGALNGEYREFYDDGNILKISHYKDGKLNGECKTWWFNGNISIEAIHKDHQLHGKLVEHREDGTLERECEYKKGKLHGEWKEWYSNGKLKEQSNYKDGNKDGEYSYWYDNEQLQEQTTYKNGLKDGYERVFMNNGDRVMESEYKEDKLHGEHKRYFQNKLILHSHYKNGVLDGEYSEYNIISGNLEDKKHYVDGIEVNKV